MDDDERKARVAYVKRALGPHLERLGVAESEHTARFIEWRAAELPTNWRELAARREADQKAFADLLALGTREWSTAHEGEIRTRLMPNPIWGNYRGTDTMLKFGAFVGWPLSRASIAWCLRGLQNMSRKQRTAADLFVIDHQAGGHSCLQLHFLARPLALSKEGLATAGKLTSEYYHYLSGRFDSNSPHDIEEYRNRVASLGLAAADIFRPKSGHRIVEGAYPLDANPTNLAVLAAEERALEPLQAILQDPAAKDQLAIIIIADNSD